MGYILFSLYFIQINLPITKVSFYPTGKKWERSCTEHLLLGSWHTKQKSNIKKISILLY